MDAFTIKIVIVSPEREKQSHEKGIQSLFLYAGWKKVAFPYFFHPA